MNTSTTTLDALLGDMPRVRAAARSLVRDAASADDLVQDALVVALRKRREVAEVTPGWARATLRNLTRNGARRRASRDARERGAARTEAVPAAGEAAAQAERSRDVSEALLGLAEPYRSVILLRYVEGLPPRKIAARTGANVEAVKKQLTRGQAQLKRALKAKYGDGGAWAVALLPLTGPKVMGGVKAVGTSGVAAYAGVGLLALGGSALLALELFREPGPAAPAALDDVAVGRGGAPETSPRERPADVESPAKDRGARRSQAADADQGPGPNREEDHPMNGRIVLDVKDAVTGALLSDIWVQEPVVPFAAHMRQVPARKASALARSPESPVEFAWMDEGGSARIRPVEVFVPGYATMTVDVNVVRGGRYEVLMPGSCALSVQAGCRDYSFFHLEIADAHSGEIIVGTKLRGSGPFVASGLAPGRVLVTATDLLSGDFGAAEVMLRPSSPATANLVLTSSSQPLPMSLVFDVPQDMALPKEFAVEYRVGRRSNPTVVEKLLVSAEDLEPYGARLRLAIDTPPVRFGFGLAWAEELAAETAFLHTLERPAVVELRVPDPLEFEVIFVDAITGQRTPHMQAAVGAVVDNVVVSSKPIQAVTPGRFQVALIGQRVSVDTPAAHGYCAAAGSFSPTPGEVIVVPVEPLPSLLVGLCEASDVKAPLQWPVGAAPVMRKEGAPNAKYRYEFEDGGVRLWVDHGSLWTLQFPDLPGFQSGQECTLWFGEDTELSMVRYGLER